MRIEGGRLVRREEDIRIEEGMREKEELEELLNQVYDLLRDNSAVGGGSPAASVVETRGGREVD